MNDRTVLTSFATHRKAINAQAEVMSKHEKRIDTAEERLNAQQALLTQVYAEFDALRQEVIRLSAELETARTCSWFLRAAFGWKRAEPVTVTTAGLRSIGEATLTKILAGKEKKTAPAPSPAPTNGTHPVEAPVVTETSASDPT